MNPITIMLVVIVAFLAGMEGILDEWEFHHRWLRAPSSAWLPVT